jgi:hypothetical protein
VPLVFNGRVVCRDIAGIAEVLSFIGKGAV